MYLTCDMKMKLAKELVKQCKRGTLHEYQFKGTSETFHIIASYIDEMTGHRVTYNRMLQNITLNGLNWKMIESWINFYKGV